MLRPLALLLALAVALPLAAPTAHAQLIDRIKRRVQRDAEQRVEERAVQAARKTLDLAEDAIVCAVTDEACIKEARRKGQEPVVVDAEGRPVSGYPPAGSKVAAGASGADTVWANYDFAPGERVLFVHDFEGTRVGNFPSRLDYLSGTLDVVRMGTGEAANQVLRVGEGTSEREGGGAGCFSIPLAEPLPERFTLEFRLMTTDPLGRVGFELFSDGSDDTPDTRCNYPPNPHLYVTMAEQGLKMPGGYGAAKAGGSGAMAPNVWTAVALGCDGPYCKMYVNGKRVANVPRYALPRDPKLHVNMRVYRHGLFLDDVRIAEGGARSLYDDLVANGFVSTTGIRFDTGSARLRPESGAVLGEVLAMMQAHDDLRLRVEGHTDDVGAEASNEALSERRAAAVVAWLTGRGVAPGRLEAVGRGEGEPVADNATPEGRAQNRRVVLRALR